MRIFFVVIIALAGRVSHAEKKVTYDEHIRPLFESKCFSCHNPDKTKGGLDLTNYNGVVTGGSSGSIVSAGDPSQSFLYSVITHEEEPVMPPKGDKLDNPSTDLVARWLRGGLLESSGSRAVKAKTPNLLMDQAITITTGVDGPPPMPQHLLLEPTVTTIRAGSITGLATSPHAPLVAVTGQKQVLLYRIPDLELLGILPYPEGFPSVLSFSRNGKIILAGGGRHGKSGNVVAWDVTTGKRVLEVGAEFDTVLAADISPSLDRAALGGPSKKLKLYDTESGHLLHPIEKHTGWVMATTFSPDGRYLASGDRDGNLFVWDADTGYEIHTLEPHKATVTGLAWRPDSEVLASVSEDGQLRLWEMETGKKIKNWAAHKGGILSVSFERTGKLATTGRDRTLKFWDGGGKLLKELRKSDQLILKSDFGYAGKHIVSGGWDGSLVITETGTGRIVGESTNNPPTLVSRIAKWETSTNAARSALEKARRRHTGSTTTASAHPTVESQAKKAAETAKNLDAAKVEFTRCERRLKHWKAAVINTRRLAIKSKLAEQQRQIAILASPVQKGYQKIMTASQVAAKLSCLQETSEALSQARSDLRKTMEKIEHLKIGHPTRDLSVAELLAGELQKNLSFWESEYSRLAQEASPFIKELEEVTTFGEQILSGRSEHEALATSIGKNFQKAQKLESDYYSLLK